MKGDQTNLGRLVMVRATFSLYHLSDMYLRVLERVGTRKRERTSLSPGTPKQFFPSPSHPVSKAGLDAEFRVIVFSSYCSAPGLSATGPSL